MSIITTIASNWQEIGAAIGLIMGGARIIVMLTPTPKDDGVLDSVVGLLKKIGLHIEKK